MTLLEPPPAPQAKSRQFIWMGLLTAVAVLALGWWMFRYYPEKKAAERFFEAVAAGDMTQAYHLWKPANSYTMQDFLADWGPTGYYGPVKSYEIFKASAPRGGSGVIVSVWVSPYSPMPPKEDVEKSRKTRVVSVWVEGKAKSFSSPP